MSIITAIIIVLVLVLLLVVGTVWIWLPIVLIVRKVKKNKMKQEGAMVQNKGVAIPDEWRIKELNNKIHAELDKNQPNIEQLKKWRQEIERLESAQPVQRSEQAMPAQIGSPQTKTQQDHSGLNALLYIGGLLVVAGAGGLMMATATGATGFGVLLMMAAIFYVGGLLVRRDQRLLPAGNALVGTGLAIIPFLGLAMAGYLRMPGEIAWLITSVVGLVAYIGAAYLMNSKTVAYLAMIFWVSIALAMSATLGLALVWYFVLVMAAGIVLALVQMGVKTSD